MCYLKLVACLAFFTTAFALFGIAATHDTGGNPVVGAVGGGLAGLLFGLVVWAESKASSSTRSTRPAAPTGATPARRT